MVDGPTERIEVEAGFDTYQGMSWSERASLGPLQAGLDPGDTSNRWNAHLDAVQRIGLEWGLGRATSVLGAEPHRLLDFGCGAGRMLSLLARHGEAWGSDRSPAMLGAARGLGVVPSDRLFVWDGSTPPAVQPFDVVVTVGVTLTPSMLEAVGEALPHLTGERAVYVGVEQVDRRRALTLSAYQAALSKAGFRIVEHRLVRRGSKSPALALASRLPARAPFTPALARLEWLMAPALGVPRDGYADVVMIGYKEPATAGDRETGGHTTGA